MFDAFEVQTEDASALGKRLVVSFGLAAVTLVGIGVGVAAIASRPETAKKEKQVDVSFRPPPPPPEPVKVEPPPKPKPKPPPPKVVAEVPPPAPAAMVAPKELPKEKPKESETVVEAIAVEVGGTGNGKMDEGPVQPDADESAAPVIASAGSTGPVNLPEDADPPVPNEDNAQPEYPESARTTGQEAKVVLKIVVESDGRVGRIQVLKGEEPFVSAALAVVRTWTYEPATLDGAPITVFKIVNITFSLRE